MFINTLNLSGWNVLISLGYGVGGKETWKERGEVEGVTDRAFFKLFGGLLHTKK